MSMKNSHRVFVYLHFAETTCTGAAVKNVNWASYTLKNVTHLMEKMTMYWAFLICIIHQNNMCHNNILQTFKQWLIIQNMHQCSLITHNKNDFIKYFSLIFSQVARDSHL